MNINTIINEHINSVTSIIHRAADLRYFHKSSRLSRRNSVMNIANNITVHVVIHSYSRNGASC